VPPVATLLTYSLLQLVARGARAAGALTMPPSPKVKLDVPQQIWTGLVLLFSAGSFLYVSTIHIMPELLNRDSPDTDISAGPPMSKRLHRVRTGELAVRGPHSARSIAQVELAAILAGMFTPLLLQVDHGHGHSHGGHGHSEPAHA
jgi:hypothetical protein